MTRDRYGPPDVLKLEDIARPSPGGGDVLVRVRAASVNAADLEYLRGVPPITHVASGLLRPRHRVLGFDAAGEVEAVGAGVTRFRVGDSVFTDLGEYGCGAFAEYACAPERAFARMPEGLTFEEASTVPEGAILALQGLRGRHRIDNGDKVLVNGAGGSVGPFAVQIAKHYGAEVTAVDTGAKLDMLRSIGADHVIDHTRDDIRRTGNRYDMILDIAAHRPLSKSVQMLERGGAYIVVGGPTPRYFQALLLGPWFSATQGKKTNMVMWKPFKAEDVATLTEMLETGSIRPVIDRTFPLEELPEALRIMEAGTQVGKLVIAM